MASSFLAPPLPILSSLRQPQIHPSCASLCPSSLTAAFLPHSGSPGCNSCCRCRRRRRCPSLPILCSSINSRAAYASEEERKKKLLESYGLDPSDFLSRSDNELRRRRRRRRDQGDELGKGVPVFQESKPPLRTTHKLLQVLGGKARRKKLLSPKGMDVRPMMEVVKGAAFGILQVAGGCPASLRPGRWLDLYSGTGAVGIEAISRGCSEAHFVEMDPWVVSKVLQPNLELTGFSDVSVIHTVRVERFFEQAERSLGYRHYISIVPFTRTS